jgi:hypothetical protein
MTYASGGVPPYHYTAGYDDQLIAEDKVSTNGWIVIDADKVPKNVPVITVEAVDSRGQSVSQELTIPDQEVQGKTRPSRSIKTRPRAKPPTSPETTPAG